MSYKIGINGFGRIGRVVFRLFENDPDIDVVAINDLTDPGMMAHLLKYDSVHGVYDKSVKVEDSNLVVGDRTVPVYAERDPSKLPWKSLEVDIVLECTGIFRTREKAALHIDAGANAVIVSAPTKGEDVTIVVGVNDDQLDPAKHKVISCGSCTTNCLAPVVKVIDEKFGLEHGLMTTIHSYTNDQRLLDFPHSDKRRARAAAVSMIPSTTGAAVAIGKVLPHLKGRLDGLAVRVPTPNVSLTDLVANTTKPATAEAINDALREAAAEGPLKGILRFEEDELVSQDFMGSHYSSIVDAPNTKVVGENLFKILSWYDNEWGFSCRMLDLTRMMLGLPRAEH